MPSYERDELHSRPSRSGAPGPYTTRRTFGNDGFQFTVETTSFSSPGRSFPTPDTFGNNTVRYIPAAPQASSRSEGAHMLGTAFNLFEDLVTLRQQRREHQATQATKRRSGRRGSRKYSVEDTLDQDEGFEHGRDSRRRDRPRGLLANLAERYVDNAERARGSMRPREKSPVMEMPKERRKGRRNRSDERQPHEREHRTGRFRTRYEDATEEEEFDCFDTDDDDSDSIRGPQSHTSSDDGNASIIEALEKAGEHHRREIRDCKIQIQLASTRPYTSTATLQALIDELRTHEESYASVKRKIEQAKTGKSSQRSAPYHSRPSASRRSSTAAGASPLQDAFGFGDFEAFFGPRRSSYQGFANFGSLHGFSAFGATPFGAFDSFFTDHLFGPKPFFGVPPTAFTGNSRVGSGFSPSEGTSRQFPRQPPPSVFTPPKPQPPATLLRPQEAKSLFHSYNERWNALAPTDPNIPYPCRGLQAHGLTARDSLWAPHLRSPIANWSEDAVMHANAQAFYLGVVGLAPAYTEAPGTGMIVRGYDKARATPAQMQQLIDILKKEKTRWHSDRLGRRNGGGVTAGVNEELQRDERARAVFHAVCELMEFTQ